MLLRGLLPTWLCVLRGLAVLIFGCLLTPECGVTGPEGAGSSRGSFSCERDKLAKLLSQPKQRAKPHLPAFLEWGGPGEQCPGQWRLCKGAGMKEP